MNFDEAKANFFAAARYDLHAQLTWNNRSFSAAALISDHLLPLARQGLRVEFWTEGVEGEHQTGYAYLSTDQVRFYRENEQEPMPLEEVPPLVFSEVMRDVVAFATAGRPLASACFTRTH